MPYWYEVFDNEQVQFLTRKRIFQITAGLLAAGCLSVATILYTLTHPTPYPLVALAIVLIWLPPAAWLVLKLFQLRRVVWCVKISDREVIGYDYARRKKRFDWLEVDRINLSRHGLEIVSPARTTALSIPHLYPDFAALSHRIVEYAELYRIPICVDGKPWEDMELSDIYPFIPRDAGGV